MKKIPCEPMIGSDTEGFIFDNANTCYVPCVGLLPGTKEEPHQFSHLQEGFCVQEDNVMVEWNIPPIRSTSEWSLNIATIKRAVAARVSEVNDNYSVDYLNHVDFELKDLQSPQAQLIGCEPDYDAYNGGKMRMAPNIAGNTWRGAGFHVHLGGNFQCPDFVAALFADACISFVNQIRPSKHDKRAQWYGKPGIYRPKPYGIEYRTLPGSIAGTKSAYNNVGARALDLAVWLSNSDAVTIQSAFRDFGMWHDVRRWLTRDPDAPAWEVMFTRMHEVGMPV